MCPDYEGNECYIVRDVAGDSWEKIDRQHYPKPSKPEELLYPSFRKPGSGMIQMAIDDYGSGYASWYIGDREEDALAAAEAKINFMWADVWRDRFKKGFNQLDLSSRHIDKNILLQFLKT